MKKKRKLPDDDVEEYDPAAEDDVAAEPIDEPEEEEEDDMTPIPMTSIVTRKTGLNSLLPNEILRTKIRDLVDAMNFIRYHGSRLLHLYVVQMCSEGRDLGLLTCSYGGILRHFFVAVCYNSGNIHAKRLDNNVAPLAEIYRNTAFEYGIEFPLNTGISSTLNNMITTTTVGRVRRWLMHLLELEYPDCFKVKKRSTSGANYCISSLSALLEENNELPELPDILEKFAKKHDRARIMRALRTKRNFLKEYWYKFFYLQYHILEHFTKYSEADAQARLEENRRGKGLRLFTMVPLADIKTSHAFFDSSGLSEVVHMAFEDESFVAPPNHPRNLNVTSRKALFTGKKSRVPLWNWAVELKCVKHTNLDFNYSFSTDGVSVSVHFKKPGFKERLNDKGFLWSNQMKYSPIGIENRVVVGVDPGRIDLVVCSDGSRKSFGCSGKEWQEIAGFSTDGLSVSVHFKKPGFKERLNDTGFLWSNQMKYSPIAIENRVVVGVDPGRIDLVVCSDGSRKSFGCSGKEWQEIAGFRYQRWRQKSWSDKNDNIQTIIRDMHSAKVRKVEVYLTYLNYILRHYASLADFYGSQRWRQLRRKTDIMKTKTFDIVCRRIAGNNFERVVAYGSGGFSSCSRGHAPLRVKGLFKALKQKNALVRLVWEHRTSKLCCQCEGELPEGKRWQVRICKTCKIHWNRDFNAANNIRKILKHMEENSGDRPCNFLTKKQQKSKGNDLIVGG
ncbi:hypothetical protein MP638_005688 [Amoeboaphelidium occidentale]|nr:hypothetical protein MP638_005688 [Amoeboaphelidium occidentale]